jgi:hypothetical protein
MDVGESMNKYMPILYIGGILIVVFVIFKIMTGLGLIKTGAAKKEDKDKKIAVQSVRDSEYFNPLTAQNANFKHYPVSLVDNAVQKLREAMKGFGTDEEAIFAVFEKLYNKFNICQLSAGYQLKYNSDLVTDLMNELSESEVKTLYDIINKLPKM